MVRKTQPTVGKIERISIADLFAKYNINIPPIQRDFDWSRPQAQQFIEDLETSILNILQGLKNFEDFGSIDVYEAIENVLSIYDGQQRLTTTLIFLIALRDAALDMWKDNSDTEYFSLYHQIANIISPRNADTLLFEYHYTKTDRHIKSLINEDKKKDGTYKVLRKNITLIYNEFYDYFWDNFTDNGIKKVEEMSNHVLDYYLPTLNFATTEYEAATKFEKKNNRGLGVSEINLIKSQILTAHKDHKDYDELLQAWDYICTEGNLLYSQRVKLLTSYFEIANNESRKRGNNQVVIMFSDWLDDDQKVIDGTREIFKYYKIWEKIVVGDTGNSTLDAILKKYQDGLYTQHFGVILAGYMGGFETDKKFYDVLNYFFNVHLHMVKVCKQPGNRLYNYYPIIANYIRWDIDNALSNTQKTCKQILSTNGVTNETIKSQFRTAEWNHPTAKYILALVEPSIIDGSAKLGNKVSLEHIMPQDRTHWNHISESDHLDTHKLIGNLCLISQSSNSSAQNKSFVDKKSSKTFESVFTLTQEIQDKSDWTVDDIRNRCEDLAERFLKAHPV